MAEKQKHIPVMLDEVLSALAVKDGATYIDATFGNGGYSKAILDKANCNLIAIDRDPGVQKRAEEFKNIYQNRFEFKSGCFAKVLQTIKNHVDGIVFDIGVSSMQLDEADRGFSFSKEAPLDMRMSQSGTSAYDIVNNASESELADILYLYGEEKKSRQIAKRIVEARTQKPIQTTTELANIIYGIIYKKKGQIDPATRTFQALRIAVNDELDELRSALQTAASILKPEGRLVVVDFHSLEDRIVKNFFKENSDKKIHISRYEQTNFKSDKIFSFVSKALTPAAEEIEQNARSRSAKLRFAIKNKGETHD